MDIPLALAAAVLFAATAAAAAATATDDDFRDGDFVSDPSSASSQSIEGVIETTCSADTSGDIFLPQ